MRKIAVIGLGYVGLPVAAAFGRAGASVIGFDVNSERISELKAGKDRTLEVDPGDLNYKTLNFTSDPLHLKPPTFSSSRCQRRSMTYIDRT